MRRLIEISDIDIDTDIAGHSRIYVICGLGDGRREWQMKEGEREWLKWWVHVFGERVWWYTMIDAGHELGGGA